MMNIGFPELVLILVIVILVFGAKRIPELGAGLGKAIRSFNKGMQGDDKDTNEKDQKPSGGDNPHA